MKQAFIRRNFSAETTAIIKAANSILDEYQAQGYRITLRGIYYQFIQRDLFPGTWIDRAYNLKHGLQPDTKNTLKNYKRLGSILNDARYAGLVDWDAIVDNTRAPEKASEFDGLEGLSRAALASYRLDRWRGQEHYVEVWVEKDALANVLQPLANEWHIPLMVNRGYSSASAMYESARRLARATKRGHEPSVIYLGDHDPSGKDMPRDIADRLAIMGAPVDINIIALTMEQVEEYQPPPNPAKTSDSRYERYAEQHGTESWEVDALPPPVLGALIRGALRAKVDREAMEEVIEQERVDKRRFARIMRDAGEADLGDDDCDAEEPPWEDPA